MKKQITDNWVIILMLIATVVYHYYIHKEPASGEAEYDQLVDSIGKIEKDRRVLLTKLKQEYTSDSIDAAGLLAVVPTYTTAVTKIKTKHNEVLHSYNNLAIDSQLVFFSNWLSSETSTR